MKTPLKPGLDDEIYEVEARIAQRRERLPRIARDTRRSALHAAASPVGLAAAAALGFLAGGGLRRNGHHRRSYKQSYKQKEQTGKGIALGSLLMSGAVALLKAQFGSPAQMAQLVLSKFHSRKHAPSPPGDRPRVAG